MAAHILDGNPSDVPFGLLYLLDADDRTARLTATCGVKDERVAPFAAIDLEDEGAVVWPLAESARRGGRIEVTDLAGAGALPGGPLASVARKAVVLPLARSGEALPYGFAVIGVSPARTMMSSSRIETL